MFYAGLNTIDVLHATGKLQTPLSSETTTEELHLGYEFAGICNKEKVMGLVESGGLSFQLESLPRFSWNVPDRWTLEDAATVPFAYAMVKKLM